MEVSQNLITERQLEKPKLQDYNTCSNKYGSRVLKRNFKYFKLNKTECNLTSFVRYSKSSPQQEIDSTEYIYQKGKQDLKLLIKVYTIGNQKGKKGKSKLTPKINEFGTGNQQKMSISQNCFFEKINKINLSSQSDNQANKKMQRLKDYQN